MEKRLQSLFSSLSRMFNLRDVKLAPTYISNSLSAALPTLFVQFTSAIRLSPSQRTHEALSCCAALIETANNLSQAKWAGRNRGRGKKTNKTQHQKVAAEEILSRDLRCLVTLPNCVFHVNSFFFFTFFVTCFVQNVSK